MVAGRTFRTVFVSDVDTTGEAKVASFAARTTAQYDKIAAAAARATAAAGLVGGSGSGGLGITTSLTRQADAQRRVADSALSATTSTQRFAAANALASRGITEAAVANEALAKSLGSASTALGIIQGPLGPVAGRVRALSGALREFSVSSLGLVGVGAALFGIVELGNQYTAIQTKLRPFFDTQTQTNEALARVVGIADRARSSLEPIADLYLRLTTLQKEFKPGTDINQLTETIAKASTLSGGSAENQAEGIRQLTQGLGRGILNGQDLRALEEDSFNLAKTIADGLGVNVGKLKQLGQEGKLTTDVVVASLERERFVIEGQFARLPVTLSSAGREFKNALTVFVGSGDQALGLTHSLAEALAAVAHNIGPIAAVGAALGAAFVIPRGGAALLGFLDDVTRKTAERNQLSNAIGAGTATPISAAPEGRALAVAQAEAEAARAREAEAAEAARLAQERQADLDAEIAKIRARTLAIRESAAEDVAAAETRVQAARAAATAEVDASLAAATAAAENARAQELGARQALQNAAAARAQAEGRVVSAQANLDAATGDTTGTRAARNRAIETADRSLQVAEAELTVAVNAEAEAQAAAGAAEADRLTARQALNALLAEGTAATADITAAEEAYTVALARETEVNGAIAASIPQIVALRNEATVAAVASREADLALAEATTAVGEAEVVAAEKTSLFKEALAAAKAVDLEGALLGLATSLFSVQTAIFVATAALIYYTTKTSELETVIDGLNQKQKDQIDLIGKTAQSYENLSVAAIKAARDQAQGKIAPAKDAFVDAQNQFVGALRTNLQGLSKSDPRYAKLEGIISDASSGRGVSPDSLYSRFSDLGLGNQTAGQSTFRRILTLGNQGADATQVSATYTALKQAGLAVKDTIDNFTSANDALANSGKQATAILTNTGRTLAQVKDDAAVAANNGTAAAQEAALHRKNVADLDAKFRGGGDETDPTGAGKTLSAEQAAAAQAAYAAEDRRHNAALANVRSETAASHAAAQTAKQDQLGALDDQRLNALIDLERRRGTLTVDAYNAEKEAIDARYDREKAQIDATGARSHTALQQQLADLQALNKKYDDASNKVDAFSQRFTDQPKPQAQYDAAISNLEKLRGTTDAGGNSIDDRIDAAERNATSPVTKALRDYVDEQEQSLQITGLQATGQDAIASALQKAYDLQRDQGDISRDDLDTLIKQAQEHERINALLSDRKRITDTILGTVDSTRSALSNLLSGQSTPKQFGATILQNFKSAQADILTTKLFAGVDPAVKELFQPSSAADKAQDQFAATVQATGGTVSEFDSGIDKTVSAVEKLNDALFSLTDHLNAAASGSTGSVGGGVSSALSGLGEPALNVADPVPDQVDFSDATKKAFGLTGAAADPDQIVVTAKLPDSNLNKLGSILTTKTPSLADAYGAIGKGIGVNVASKFESLFAKHGDLNADANSFIRTHPDLYPGESIPQTGLEKTLGSIGSTLGTALGGAATGDTVNQFLAPIGKALGIKTSKTGSEIGGALGALSGIPGGNIIGSIAGGLIGGLFKTTKKGQVTLGATDGEASIQSTSGNSSSKIANATAEGKTVVTNLNSIADALNGTVGAFSVSIGQRDKKFTVDTSGQGKTKGSTVEKFKTAEEAEQAALADALSDGAIKGISAASQKILASGQDITTAIQKASVIESIPRQLEALTDPVKYAVDELNDSFTKTIDILNEGGATAEQYAQAQDLYTRQRAAAITEAAKSVFGTVEDYITSLTAGSDSPLNKQTTYENAKSAFASIASQIDAGKTVDQNDLVTAAKNLQSGSRAVNGSDTDFFTDFNYVLAELKKADATATAGVNTSATQDLPASPFTTDQTAAAALASLTAKTGDASTAQISAIMTSADAIVNAIAALKAATGGSGTGITSLLAGSRASA